MLYAKLILGAIVVLLIIYYVMIVGQTVLVVGKLPNKKIKFNKLIIPFYYWMV